MTLLWRHLELALQRVTDLLKYLTTPDRPVERWIFRKTQECIAEAHWHEHTRI